VNITWRFYILIFWLHVCYISFLCARISIHFFAPLANSWIDEVPARVRFVVIFDILTTLHKITNYTFRAMHAILPTYSTQESTPGFGWVWRNAGCIWFQVALSCEKIVPCNYMNVYLPIRSQFLCGDEIHWTAQPPVAATTWVMSWINSFCSWTWDRLNAILFAFPRTNFDGAPGPNFARWISRLSNCEATRRFVRCFSCGGDWLLLEIVYFDMGLDPTEWWNRIVHSWTQQNT